MTFSTVELNPGAGGARSLHDSSLASVDGEPPPTSAVAQMVEVLGRNAAYWPGYNAPSEEGVRTISVDDGGALVTRGAVTTDEGTFRLNFANTSLAIGIGIVSVTEDTVTGSGFLAADAHYKDYFKLASDPDSAWMQIASIESDTQIKLVTAYVGGSLGTGQRCIMKPVIGSGGNVTVASGQATIAAGTTAGATTGIVRYVDYAPLVFRARFSISQRIANQAILSGLRHDAATPRWFARFRLEGTTNTTLICETGRNPTGAPSVAETESTTITLPFGLTSAALVDYRVELLTESVRFYINGARVAEHVRVIPHPHDEMASAVEVINGTTPGSNTNVVVDYVTGKNHNKLEVGVLSDAEQIIAKAVPLVPFAFSQAGIIAINTDLITLDCRQIRSLMIGCRAIGTTGVVTVQWSHEPTFATPFTATLLSEAGAIGTTFNAAGLRYANVLAPFCRLRLTTATTAGTTTIDVWGSENPIPVLVGTQPVSGTVTANQGTMVALPAGSNLAADVGIQYRANATGGASTSHIVSAASVNAANVKNAAGRVVGWSFVNTTGAFQYVKLHNTAGTPTAGAGVVMTIAIPANGVNNMPVGAGSIAFTTGIGRSIVTGSADTDATATTLGAVVGDLFFA
jgi:hypothetical protein